MTLQTLSQTCMCAKISISQKIKNLTLMNLAYLVLVV